MRSYRLKPDGTKWPPALQNGCFVLGDSKLGSDKNQPRNEAVVRTAQEAIDLLRKGYSIRIKTSSRPSLICKNLYIDGLTLEHFRD